MSSFMKRISRFESHIDAAIEKFVFHNRVLGLLIIFIGMPLVTLAAVYVCTTIIILPFALMFGWA